MKHILSAISITLLLLTGCAGTQEVAAPTERVELISMTPLPPIAQGSYHSGMRLNVLIHIQPDGTVEDAECPGPAGTLDGIRSRCKTFDGGDMPRSTATAFP